MLSFEAIIRRYSDKGEKTGWTYVDIPPDILKKLKLKDRKSFRIKGKMDDIAFEKLSTYPVGEGNFIIAINSTLKKKLGKKEGAKLKLAIEIDASKAPQSKELLECLAAEPMAIENFKSLPVSHQNYFHRYIVTAKGADTRAGRIVHTINAMLKKQNFGEMIRSLKKR